MAFPSVNDALGISAALGALQLILQSRNVLAQLLPPALHCDQSCIGGLQLPFQARE
jgi:hypothetical protein